MNKNWHGGVVKENVGNRTAVNDSVSGNTGYTANNLNEYTAVGADAPAYDANGNLTLRNTVAGYQYDSLNRLILGVTATGNTQLSYDARNRIVSKTVNGATTYYYYDAWNLIEERDASGNLLQSYIHGARLDELLSKTDASNNTVFYHHNALGSTVALTDSTGNVVEKYTYDVYGTASIFDGSGNALTASAYGNRFLFTGREYFAELNLYNFRNRMYSAELGRFLQTDPLRFGGGDINFYRYCSNDPIGLIDLFGLCKIPYFFPWDSPDQWPYLDPATKAMMFLRDPFVWNWRQIFESIEIRGGAGPVMEGGVELGPVEVKGEIGGTQGVWFNLTGEGGFYENGGADIEAKIGSYSVGAGSEADIKTIVSDTLRAEPTEITSHGAAGSLEGDRGGNVSITVGAILQASISVNVAKIWNAITGR